MPPAAAAAGVGGAALIFSSRSGRPGSPPSARDAERSQRSTPLLAPAWGHAGPGGATPWSGAGRCVEVRRGEVHGPARVRLSEATARAPHPGALNASRSSTPVSLPQGRQVRTPRPRADLPRPARDPYTAPFVAVRQRGDARQRGEVTERPIVLAWKASERAPVPWVRIPPSPPILARRRAPLPSARA